MTSTAPNRRLARVLVADPYQPAAVALRQLLVDHALLKVQVDVALDGHQALTIGRHVGHEVVVLAQGLRRIAADVVAAGLRDNSSRRLALVFVAVDRNGASDATASGLYDLVLTQPVDVGRLLDVVDRHGTAQSETDA